MDESLRPEVLIGVAGLASHALFSLVMAVLLLRFYRRIGRGYLRDWAGAWMAIAAASLAAAWSVARMEAVPAGDPLRLLTGSIYSIGGYWHAALLLMGAASIATGRALSRRGQQLILGILLALGLATTLLWAFEPGASAERHLVRVGVRALVIGIALLGAGLVLARVAHGRSKAESGPGFVRFAFIAKGAQQLLHFAAVAGWIEALPIAIDVPVNGLLTGTLGVGIVVWLLEEEQYRLREASRQIERLAFFDPVTGLPNRQLFVERLRGWLSRMSGDSAGGALISIDLDRFRAINERAGHEAGDQVLAAVSDRLLRSAGEGEMVARLGADEFAMLLPGTREAERAEARARALLERVQEPLRVGGHQLQPEASIGVALCPEHGVEAAILLRKADAAMSRAKAAGGGRVEIWDAARIEASREPFALEQALREGRLESDLELRFQPIVRCGSGEIVGAEALLRLRHPERGLLSPPEFLFASESAEVSDAISHWVLRNACAAAAAWRRRFGGDLRVAVNLTARAFEDPWLATRVAAVLAETGLPAHALELEITETMALLQVHDPVPGLAELRARGTRVAVDDFGTGYSSLSYLRELPIEIVKLDSSFIRDLGRRPRDSRIVGAVVQLAHGLGLEVVAEGVEEEGQMAVLEMLHCDRMQGFLFSRPLPLDEFERLLDTARPFQERTDTRPDLA